MLSRTLLGIILVAVLALGLIFVFDNKDVRNGTADRELVIVSYGGSYQDAQRKAFFEPFEKQFNVTIRDESYAGDLTQIEHMVNSRNVSWDVVAIETSLLNHGAGQNLFEPIDYDVVNSASLLPQAVHDYGVALCFWSNIMAYNTEQFSGSDAPMNWQDFWNVENYPGPRSLHDTPISTLEMALLADGVTLKDLYPLDVDRAFESLDRIRDSVAVWWDVGEQPAELLARGDVVMASAWSGRIYNHREAGEPVQSRWQGGLIDADWWVIPRGSRNKEMAMEFIAFASQAEPQANFPTYIPYGPVNEIAIESIPANLAADIPTSEENVVQQIFINGDWWNENYDRVLALWQAWRQQ